MKRILLSCVCAMALSACTAGHPNLGSKGASTTPKTGQSIASDLAAMPHTDMPTDPSVQTYNTSGQFSNPLVGDHRNGMLDNSMAGGYTMFDDNVTVYPLPGEGAPAFVPSYSVPPLKGQYDGTDEAQDKPQPGMIGKPMGLASAGMLPPVKNVDVKSADPFAKPPVAGQVRKPLHLTAPEPTTLQAPVSASAGPRSPFKGGMLTAADNDDDTPDTAPAPAAATQQPLSQVKADMPSMAVGRRSGPSLTGY